MLKFLGRGSAFTDEHNSAFFVENNEFVLLDCSMTTFRALNDFDMTLYDRIYVLVTHTHGDHVSGIGMLIDLMHFTVKTPVTVVAPSMTVKEDLHYMLSRLEGCGSDWFTLVSSDEIKKDWLLCSVPTKHTEELDGRCFGYLLNVHGVNVVYTGDTSTILPFEKYLSEGTYLYTEMSAYKSPVHLYCEDMAEKIKAYKAAGVHVYLMHMDDEEKIMEIMKGTGAEPAPLLKGELHMEENGQLLDRIYEITDSLYKDMCMNRSSDHNLVFSYLTELGKMLVGADRASFWKWDKRKGQIWTMSATGVDKITMPDNKGLVGKALREKKIVVTNDPYSEPDFNKDVDIKTGYTTKSVLVLPVADINGSFIGALQLINKNDPNGFDEEQDAKKLSLAALVCGIALESETFLEDSHHDKLTGLRNRMGFYYDFSKKYKDYTEKESGKKMSLFICDIDKFKRVNDTYGHNAGDDVLAFTAHLLEECCGENDSIYRWGGEEFIMIMRDTDLEGAVQKAEGIRVKLMESDIDADGTTIRCTLSFGCSLFDTDLSIEENVSAADEKLYTAKESGRNRVCY